MHELAVCQALVDQLTAIARDRGATRVERVLLRVGPLSGVEAPLLRHAYPVATAGTVAEGSELEIETAPVRVACQACGAETEARPNRLVCGACGDWRTRLVAGDEMTLVSLELVREAAGERPPARAVS